MSKRRKGLIIIVAALILLLPTIYVDRLCKAQSGPGSTATGPIPSAADPVVSGGGDILDGGNSTGATLVIGTNDANSLELETNNSTALTIDSSGNISFSNNLGIGTTTPSYNVEVVGTVTADGMIVNDRLGIGTTTPKSPLHVSNTDYVNITDGLSFGDGDTGVYESGDDFLNIALAGSSRFKFMGNLFRAEVSPGAAMNNASAGSTTPGFLPRENDLDTGIGSAGADKLTLIVGGVEWLRLDNPGSQAFFPTGNVGINKTTPSARLHVTGSSTSSADTSLLVENSASSPLLAVINNGNVGIGTTTIGAKLVVNGTATVWGNLRIRPDNTRNIGNPTSGRPNTIYVGNKIGINQASPNSRLHITGSSTASGDTSLLVEDSASSPILVARNDGFVGIGTTTPSGALAIVSTTGAMFPPQMTTIQRNTMSGNLAGGIIYNLDDADFNFHVGGTWTTK